MATLESLAIRANAACDRIEAALGITLRRLHRNREHLRAEQLEAIADALDATPDAVATVDDDRYAAAMTLLNSGTWTKAEMEAALRGEVSA